jgi:epoxyqueuosine reductase QueG
MSNHNLYSLIKEIAYKNGACLIGVADLKKVITDDFLIEKETLNKFSWAISIAVPLLKSVLETIKDHPTQLYFHHYRQINNQLDRIALMISRYLEDCNTNYRALPIPASLIVNWQNQKAHLPHKRVAISAGLGWLGRNNLLVTQKFGAQVRLVTILTNVDLGTEANPPIIPFSCANCRKCIAVCPAGAINDDPKMFDHIKCFEKLKEFQKKGYAAQYICGICVRVCDGNL